MMKLLLSLTLIWALSSTGEALVCETCTDAACSTTAAVTCPTGTMCITASIQVHLQVLHAATQTAATPTLCLSLRFQQLTVYSVTFVTPSPLIAALQYNVREQRIAAFKPASLWFQQITVYYVIFVTPSPLIAAFHYNVREQRIAAFKPEIVQRC
ncbi:unnamed protein product [Pleuronectes platessa]|uniref:Uncharacterized protein n=1 Tax=Pleuronectes platessa TaxID=8262 RepID=A0A9N7UW44_PLEPL|nr:unnamed protein product [Pleuronectes platessa]